MMHSQRNIAGTLITIVIIVAHTVHTPKGYFIYPYVSDVCIVCPDRTGHERAARLLGPRPSRCQHLPLLLDPGPYPTILDPPEAELLRPDRW